MEKLNTVDRAIMFYDWFLELGGRINEEDCDLICSRFEKIPKNLEKSSFKHRAEEIKAKFNHQFNGREFINFKEAGR